MVVRTCFTAAADYRLWARDPQELYDVNVDGTLNILRAAADAGVSRIVYTSSVGTLGLKLDGTPSNEDTPTSLDKMTGHYKRSKFIAEQEVRLLAQRERLPVVIVNPSTPIGPRDVKPTPTGRVIVRAAAGRMPAYVDTGLNLVHVDDVADGHLFAHQRGKSGERYILGGEDWMLEDLLKEVAVFTQGSPPKMRLRHEMVLPLAYISQAWARLIGTNREPMISVEGVRMSRQLMFFSSEKARDQLGYNPRPSQEALHDAVRWFKQHRYF